MEYRRAVKEDESSIADICYRTGFMGQDLKGRTRFNDPFLFSLLFCRYYIRHEIENCFVAIEPDTKRVVGYIIGTLDSKGYHKRFKQKMQPGIICRLLTYTLWRSPKTLLQVLKWNFQADVEPAKPFYQDFPAHLHINLYKEFQGKGIGRRLVSCFENHLRRQGQPGVHLETSNLNHNAIAFYQKLGFKELTRVYFPFWQGVENHASIVMGKTIE